MDVGVFALIVVAALAFGTLLGWLIGSKQAAAAKDVTENLRTQLNAVAAERDANRDAVTKLAAMEAAQGERDRGHEQQLEALETKFTEISAKVLTQAQDTFLRRADDRFKESEKNAEKELKTLLQPVETTLKRYEEGLKQVEKDRVDHYASLREAIDQVRTGQTEVRNEAAKLVNALRAAPKTRGRWGEQQFKNLIELAGLSTYVDFREEVTVATDEGSQRPDFVIRIPGDQELVVDIKCSLDAYLRAAECTDNEERRQYLADHAKAVRTHAASLAKKSYWDQFARAPDFVIMYVPGDNFFSAALEADMEIWEQAAKKRVIICGPSTFLPMARTLASMWRQEKRADEARKIGALGKLLFERLSVAANHMKLVGGALNSAVNNYNKFVSSLETRVLVSAREFPKLGVETGGKEIDELPQVAALAVNAIQSSDATLLDSVANLSDQETQIAAE